MLTIDDLERLPAHGFYEGDRVRFILLRGLELETHGEPFNSRSVKKSANRNANRSFIGEITRYGQGTPTGNLNIEGIMDDGYKFKLRLHQCKDLKILD